MSEKLPKEDGKEKVITSLYESSNKSYIDCGLTGDMLNEIEYFDWFVAFREHYQKNMGDSAACRAVKNPFGPAINIPEDGRIEFVIDYDHQALKFWISPKDEQARDIVYSFIERLLN